MEYGLFRIIIKTLSDMKRQILSGLLALVSLFFAGFTAKAQLDTAWLAYNYTDQYIFPPIADSAYERWDLGIYTGSSMDVMFAIDAANDTNCITEIAQRFEVKDSVKIMGAALSKWSTVAYYDTVTVEVWDEDLVNTLYSKTFIVGGLGEGVQIIGLSGFVEVLFDDTITLYNDYYVSIRNSLPCDNNMVAYAAFSRFTFIHMVHYASDGSSCTPYACRTKYKPYVKMCKVNPETGRDVVSPWTYIEDVPGWTQSYDYIASYYRPAGCDTIVHTPMGICPIRALEDTVSQDTVSQDTTSSSVLSVELLERAVRLYPNPANEVLNVACDYDIESIAVFDAVNRLVEERKVNSKTLQLSLANYAQGTYFITITTPKGKLNKKFVVQ